MKELLPWLRLILTRRHRLLTGMLLMALTVLAGTALLALSGWFITASALTGLLLAAGVSVHLDVYVPGSGIRAFALTRTLARYGERLYNHDTVLRLLADIRATLFRNLGRADTATLKGTHSAVWLSRLTRDVDALDNLYLRLLAPPVVALLATILVLGAMATVLPGTAALLAAGFVILLALSLALPAWLGRQSGRNLMARESALRQQSIDYLSGLPELQAALQARARAEWLLHAQDQLQAQQRRLTTTIAITESLQSALLGALALLTLFSGLNGWRLGDLSGPVVTLWTLAVIALGEAYTSLPKAFAELGKTRQAALQLNQLDSRQATGPADAVAAPADLPLLSFQQVQPAYPGHPPLDPVTVELHPGQTLVITGQSGAGKSSLAGLLAAERPPASGQLVIGGTNIANIDPRLWRHSLSWLTQETVLFSASLRDNLLMGNPSATDRELWDMLALVNLAGRFESTRLGLDTWIGQTGLAVSGGEQRRIALARALLRPAQLYVLDEPFRGVDASTATSILPKLTSALAGKTLVWLAHETSLLPGADKSVHLTLTE